MQPPVQALTMEPSFLSRTRGQGPACGRRAAATLLVACSLLSCGCTSRLEEPQPQPPTPGGVFRTAQSAPSSLDPALLDDVYESTVINQIFEGLLRFDPNLNVVPGIADLWEVSPDGRVYTFHLKPGVRFQDGSEVTSEDVVYSFARVFHLPEAESALARESLSHIAGCEAYAQKRARGIAGLQALGPYDVRIELEQPFASFLAVLASDPARIVPRHYVEEVGDEKFGRRPLGSGPFRLATWSDDEIVLAANERYHLGRPLLDSLVFELPMQDARDYAADAFLAGKLSAALVPHGRLSEFQDHPGTRLLSRQELSLTFLGLNRRYAPFDDERVRPAVAHAIDPGAYVRRDPAARSAAEGILPPGMPGYTPASKLVPYDPERARALLAAAGYPGGRGLPRIVFTLAYQTEETRQLVEEMRQQLGVIGIVLESETLSWLDFSRRLTAQELQCFTVTWVADIPDPDSFLYPLGHHEGSGNFASYHNGSVDSLLLRGRGERAALQRMELYRDVERRILSDAPIVPLFHPSRALAVQASVRGLHMTPMGIGSLAMEAVWLQPASRAAATP